MKHKNGRTATLDEIRAEITELTTEADELLERNGDDNLDTADSQRFTILTDRLRTLKTEQRHIEHEAERVKNEFASNPTSGRFESGGSGTSSTTDRKRGGTPRDRAMRRLDEQVRAELLPATGAERVQHLLDTGRPEDRNWTARWSLAAGNPAYERAFARLLVDPTRGHMMFTPEESEAYREAEHTRAAMNITTDSQGGFLVPQFLDPAIILTNDGSANTLRAVSRVVTTASDHWSGITSAGATSEWVAEAAEVADGSPTIANPSIPVHKYDTFVPFSVELEQDGLGFLRELQKVMADSVLQLQNAAFTTGTGSGQPTGFVTALAASSPSVIVAGGGTEALADGDPYLLQNALPPRFQANASWQAALPTLNYFRQSETDNGSLKYPGLHTAPPTLLGRTVNENSNMDPSVNPAVTATNYLLAYGDFSQFVIVDRIGATLELVPHLLGPNRRPTLQRGAILYGRVGSDVLVDNAFRLLNVATTA
ncbi:phage major capsid protein [Nocardia cyriacigeorgica]|uniref:phage major capsid protein n=1 Tax=Nocardia cyriacigeorgica TaxID=135487 RepID=UPI0013B784A6|nr:phage major capsid protein [Nocardia cyriacigeorgica]NEW49952.1 phage major capsid protein [Nocardia cyriacigeorgica]